MVCPKCGSENISSAGFYVTKLYNKRNRFRCKDCGRMFVIGNFMKILSTKKEKEIIRLSKRTNPHASKFDGRKDYGNRKIRTYSIREIEKIMKVGRSTIGKVLKKNKMDRGKSKPSHLINTYRESY